MIIKLGISLRSQVYVHIATPGSHKDMPTHATTNEGVPSSIYSEATQAEPRRSAHPSAHLPAYCSFVQGKLADGQETIKYGFVGTARVLHAIYKTH